MQPNNTSLAHIPLERLAAFDDEPFTVDELAHLAACAACRAEHAAVTQVVTMAVAMGTDAADAGADRLVEFEHILAGLGATPAVDRGDDAALVNHDVATRSLASSRHRPRKAFAPLLRRAAAAMLLVGGGAIVGRLSVDGTVGPSAASPVASGAMRASATPVALADRPFADRSFSTIDEATAALNEAQRDYERASLWLASNDSTVRDPEVFRARLAALDQMMEASRVALKDAPQDPVINHYYLAAYSAREATLQALMSALPVDKTIERY